MDSGINGAQHKSTKATRHEMPTVMANNKSGASIAYIGAVATLARSFSDTVSGK